MSNEKQQARGGLETIDIKGKAYVTVAERIKAVTDIEDLAKNRYEIDKWETFELNDRQFLTCHIIVMPEQEVITAKSGDDFAQRMVKKGKRYSGTAQISFTGGMVNTTSGYENAETSALGRALAFAGIGLLEGVASADEIHKANESKPAPKKLDTEQVAKLLSLAKHKGYAEKDEAIAFVNEILGSTDFTGLDPVHFEEYKSALSAAPATEPFK